MAAYTFRPDGIYRDDVRVSQWVTDPVDGAQLARCLIQGCCYTPRVPDVCMFCGEPKPDPRPYYGRSIFDMLTKPEAT